MNGSRRVLARGAVVTICALALAWQMLTVAAYFQGARHRYIDGYQRTPSAELAQQRGALPLSRNEPPIILFPPERTVRKLEYTRNLLDKSDALRKDLEESSADPARRASIQKQLETVDAMLAHVGKRWWEKRSIIEKSMEEHGTEDQKRQYREGLGILHAALAKAMPSESSASSNDASPQTPASHGSRASRKEDNQLSNRSSPLPTTLPLKASGQYPNVTFREFAELSADNATTNALHSSTNTDRIAGEHATSGRNERATSDRRKSTISETYDVAEAHRVSDVVDPPLAKPTTTPQDVFRRS